MDLPRPSDRTGRAIDALGHCHMSLPRYGKVSAGYGDRRESGTRVEQPVPLSVRNSEQSVRENTSSESYGHFFKKCTVFGDFSKISFRRHRSLRKVTGTSLLTFLTSFWPPRRLRRLPASDFLISRAPHTLHESRRTSTLDSRNELQTMDFQGFSEFPENNDFCRKIKVVKSVPNRF